MQGFLQGLFLYQRIQECHRFEPGDGGAERRRDQSATMGTRPSASAAGGLRQDCGSVAEGVGK